MFSYELVYSHPYFIHHVDDDYSLHNSTDTAVINAETDDDAVSQAEVMMAKPTGEEAYDFGEKKFEALTNTPIRLIKIVKRW